MAAVPSQLTDVARLINGLMAQHKLDNFAKVEQGAAAAAATGATVCAQVVGPVVGTAGPSTGADASARAAVFTLRELQSFDLF
eukprot:13983627-Alexandrium_andersonii.AAC.1